MEKLFDELVSKVTLMNMMTAINDFDGYEKAKGRTIDALNDYIDKRIEIALFDRKYPL